MTFRPPKLYAITDVRLAGVSHAEQVMRLNAGGASLVQLREKHLSPNEFFRQAEEASQVCRRLGVKVIVNDRVDIAVAIKADGVHLGQDDLPPAAARRLLGKESIIGLSTHSVEQAREAARVPLDYVAVGPIFATATKQNPDPPIGLEGLAVVRRIVGTVPLIAIGGITLTDAATVLAAGADAVALISALLVPASEIAGKTRRLLASL